MANLRIIGSCAFLVLGACNGSTGVSQFVEKSDAAEILFAQTASMASTGNSSMPTVGAASYQGYALAVVELSSTEIETMYGDANFGVNFLSGDITGQIDGLVGETVGQVSGELTLSVGSITEDEFSALIGGTLFGPISSTDVSANLLGDFLGVDAAALEATAAGTTDVNGGFSGGFLASISAAKN